MTSIRRMQVLELRAAKILQTRGYQPVIVSHFVRSSRYIAFNLTARKTREDGTVETLIVKLKISLHPLASPAEAAAFCSDEMAQVKRFLTRVQNEEPDYRFEVWLAIPLDGFQQFKITRDGIREIPEPGESVSCQEQTS
ncbi:hypothetical protein [Methanoregula sp.]|uniref:hypothetical protein n=1 Tax=Methanoregula sp. TaxID=2052170 RepID=UPI0035654553